MHVEIPQDHNEAAKAFHHRSERGKIIADFLWGLYEEMQRRVLIQDERIKVEKYLMSLPSEILKSEAKRSVPVIKKWIQAYRIIKEMLDSEEHSELSIRVKNIDKEIIISQGWQESSEDILHRLELGIIAKAEKDFGDKGAIVARKLFDPTFGNWMEKEGATASSTIGPPEDRFLNKMILSLDIDRVERQLIGKLVDAVKGKYFPNKDWDELNARKRIDRHIKRLGGNLLRYNADYRVREMKECADCKWGWSREGHLVPVIRCEKHTKRRYWPKVTRRSNLVTPEGPVDWLKSFTTTRDESFYANALAWLMRKPNSEDGKTKMMK